MPGFDPLHPEPLDVEAIVGNIRQAVAEQHGLQAFAILLLKAGSIPKTSSGKIRRYACRQGFLTQTLEVVSKWQASTAPEDGDLPPSPASAGNCQHVHKEGERADEAATGESRPQLYLEREAVAA